MTEGSDTVARFGGLAGGYDRYRPGYPVEAIDAILDGLPPGAPIADVGAGTGISTRALRAAGARPIAVEPNAEMRALAVAAGLDARDGRADATGLAAASVAAVTCFQAFHWFASAPALAEFARILQPGGRLAIVWNERDLRDAFARAYRDLERRYSAAGMLAGADFSDESLTPLVRGAGFGALRLLTFPNAQRLDRDALHGRMRSTSYAPRSGAALAELTRELDALFERTAGSDGHVVLPYVTEVWLAERGDA